MAAKDNRVELEVRRDAQVVKANFLATARTMADVAFGRRHVGVTTLRSPIVEDAFITGTNEPTYKIYDPENLTLKLLWRVATGDKHAGSKFYRARQALENGVQDKSKQVRKSGQSLPVRELPLRQQMATATEMYETGPDSVIHAKFSGITKFQHELVHPGKVIFGLTLESSDAEDALITEQQTAEDVLYRVSRFTHGQVDPQPRLVIPFMRVDEHASPEEHSNFIKSIINTNLFPLAVELQPVEIGLRA